MAQESKIFPAVEMADKDGLLCVGGELSSHFLLDAYSHGIFPWPQPGHPVLWFSPPDRGIIDFSELHISRSLKKWYRQQTLKIKINENFKSVIYQCAIASRPEQNGTWILPEMVDAYYELHKKSFAHCVEIWEGNELVGGIYGVAIAGYFSAESMFYKKSNCSKLALAVLIFLLDKSGYEKLDIQMLTDITKSFGGKYITREEFIHWMNSQKKINPEKLQLANFQRIEFLQWLNAK